MADFGRQSGSQQPLGLYAQQPTDPYFYQPTSTVNLSGKIGNDHNAGQQGGTTGSTASSLMATVTSAVESSYQSARNVVLNSISGDGAGSQAAQSSQSSFSFFSLSYQQMVNFAICIIIGCFFMFLAFLFLPMVVFAPQKFVLLFTLGSLSWIAGLAMLQGPRSLFYAMVHKDRVPVSIAYVVSMAGTFYATMVAHSYLLTILMAIVQIGALVAFIVSYFPGGPRMLSMVKDVIFDRVKGIVTGGGSRSGNTVLPL